jgi:adenylate cyclase
MGKDSTVQPETRKLAAIMFTDIVGFSRQMGSNEARTLRLLDVHNQTIRHAVTEHHGTVIKTIGDAFLVDFPSVVHAVQCAQQIQAQFRAHNTEKDKPEQIHVRIGIHLGDIVQKEGDVFGDGVNIASRLQGLAEPDTVCISDVVYRDVAKKVDLGTVVSLGRPKLKNIAQRFTVYALLSEPPQGLWRAFQIQRLKLSRRVGTVVFVLVSVSVVILGGIVLLLSPSLLTLITRYSSLVTQEAQPPLPLPDKPSIVVLPFINLSKDPEQEYFSDGLTEDLTSDLSQISSLFVIARNSAFTYKGKSVKAQDVSKELGVRYVVEGSVRKADNQVRINAQLIDATTGGHIWSERYDRPFKDIFALQDEITQQIVVNLNAEVRQVELERVRRTPTSNLTAYDYLLRGWELRQRFTKEANIQARQMYEKALELDPTYALAYVALGWTYHLEWAWQWSQDPQTLERYFTLAQRALVLDGSLPQAHMLLSQAYLWKRQHELAIAEAEQAVALNPNDVWGYHLLAETLNFSGKPEEALGAAEKAMRLDPRNRELYLVEIGFAYRWMGRYEEAITALKRVLARYPNILGAHAELAACYSELGREEEARAEAAEVLRISPNFSLESMKQGLPIKEPAVLERQLAALRKAGLK